MPTEFDQESPANARPSDAPTEVDPPAGFDLPTWRFLGHVAADLSIDLEHLEDARQWTTSALTAVASAFRQRLKPDVGLDIVVFGSLARLEASQASDFDYLLVAHTVSSPRELRRYREVASDSATREAGLTPPAPTGLFGQVISATALAQHIGLDEDTNVSHTRRMLLLEESLSLYLQDRHNQLVGTILERYMLDYELHPKLGVPRFLLNDVVRYWRQVTVDYQAKRWVEIQLPARPAALKWGLRYLKLVISRKLAYAGTIASLLLVEYDAREAGQEVIPVDKLLEELSVRFRLVPLDRLAEVATRLRSSGTKKDIAGLRALTTVFEIANWFTGRLASKEFRKIANAVTEPRSPDNPPEFREAFHRAEQLERALERLFIDTRVLGPLAKHYLLF